jgi:NAD-dependent deacetylase
MSLERARAVLQQAKRIAALTGAGISAEGGVPTFRGTDGLWKQFRAENELLPAEADLAFVAKRQVLSI